ncbi:MAG: hypothetical protein ACOCUH_02880, partial [Bacteriovoracia bacterium]
ESFLKNYGKKGADEICEILDSLKKQVMEYYYPESKKESKRKTKIKLSQGQWRRIGESAGWFDIKKVPLVALVDDNGNCIKKEGYSKEMVGIFDQNGDAYPAGIDESGTLHALWVNEQDYVLNKNGNALKQWNLNKNYSELIS